MEVFVLPLIAFVAAIVNGALGHGFSSITVPLALLFVTNRILNPALVLVEVVLNAYVLWNNRESVPHVQRYVRPVLVGLLPGVVAGVWLVSRIDPLPLKLATYVLLLPPILLQAAGWRRPIQAERAAQVALGGGVGLLYALTTISGPPLALMLNNQGLVAGEFRAALGCIRLTESTLTAVAYFVAGLYVTESASLALTIVPAVVCGVPLGAFIIRRVHGELFRRLCMSFDAWIVAFGLATMLRQTEWIPGRSAYGVIVVVGLVDAWLLRRFFEDAAKKTVRG